MIAGLVRLKQLDREFRILFVLFCVEAINASLQFYLASRSINNLWLGHIYGLCEFVLFALVFSRWSSPRWERILQGVIIFYATFWVVAQFFLERMDEPALYSATVSKILLTIITIGLLHKISGDTSRRILADPRFWFLAGLLIFSSAGVMFSALRGIVDKLSIDGLVAVYNVHWAMNIVACLFYVRGFLCKPLAQNSGGQLELAQ